MHYFALACDFDQTLANMGSVAASTLSALERLLASGRKLVLVTGLSEMCISHHNAVAIGDAENDHALLKTCECGIAVSNAIQMLRERADITTSAPDGKGVEEVIDRLLADDLAGIRNRLSRQPILLGTAADGTK